MPARELDEPGESPSVGATSTRGTEQESGGIAPPADRQEVSRGIAGSMSRRLRCRPADAWILRREDSTATGRTQAPAERRAAATGRGGHPSQWNRWTRKVLHRDRGREAGPARGVSIPSVPPRRVTRISAYRAAPAPPRRRTTERLAEDPRPVAFPNASFRVQQEKKAAAHRLRVERTRRSPAARRSVRPMIHRQFAAQPLDVDPHFTPRVTRPRARGRWNAKVEGQRVEFQSRSRRGFPPGRSRSRRPGSTSGRSEDRAQSAPEITSPSGRFERLSRASRFRLAAAPRRETSRRPAPCRLPDVHVPVSRWVRARPHVPGQVPPIGRASRVK